MVCRRRRQDGVEFPEPGIHRLEPLHKPRHGPRAHGMVAANGHVRFPPTAGHHSLSTSRSRILDSEERFGQFLAESPVNLPDAFGGRRASLQPSDIDPCLHGDVRGELPMDSPSSWFRPCRQASSWHHLTAFLAGF